MTPEQLARAMNILLKVVQTRYLANGDTTLPPHRIYIIASTADPRWQELTTRNFENCIRTTYHNGPPENGRTWQSTYTYNGNLRLWTTASRYNTGNGNGTIASEIFSAVTGIEEISGGLASYIWTASDNVSEYGRSISVIPALLNLGTGQNTSLDSTPLEMSIIKNNDGFVKYEFFPSDKFKVSLWNKKTYNYEISLENYVVPPPSKIEN